MDIVCKVCGEEIPLENVNLATQVAKCDACDVVFSAEKQISQQPDTPSTELQYPLAFSELIDIATFGDDIFITRRWRTGETKSKLAMHVGLLIFVYFISGGFGSLPGFIFWLYLAINLKRIYRLVAELLNNSTEIIVCLGELIVRHKPLPWAGSMKISTENITQLYCVENVAHSKNRKVITYGLHASLSDGGFHPVLLELPTFQQARIIEQALETHLNISNRPVLGEFRSPSDRY